jgi:4-hydroxy-tetrahydrodipicolinate synthase
MVTPMNPAEEVDPLSAARLLARFEAHGCQGAVLAGTNGEGPSLAAVEKRDLLRELTPSRGEMRLILGVATASLSEAVWSVSQAGKAGAAAALVMAPAYFFEAGRSQIRDWFLRLMDASPVGILVYNFPKRSGGIVLTADLLAELAEHPRFLGVKDSSGETKNLAEYRAAVSDEHRLFVGDETLLWSALEAGWQGTISGAANLVSAHLVQVVSDYLAGEKQRAETRFHLIEPLIRAIRQHPQPATSKAVLHAWGAITSPSVRLPLAAGEPDPLRSLFESKLGVESR